MLNSGSSTLKVSLIESGNRQPEAATVEEWAGDREPALRRALGAVTAEDSRVDAVAHRVVHGGGRFTAPAIVDDEMLAALDELSAIAPLHNAVAVEVIEATRRLLPGTPQVACFDTAFHATLPEVAWRYPVPYEWAERWGVRRYGFHGLSVEWSVAEAARLLGRTPSGLSLVVAHLGSGCSVTAVRDGRSTWTSMGFTPLEGLMMSTRSGSIDPGVLLHLVRSGRQSVDDLDDALERKSGLLGVSGISADMRELRAAADRGHERASLAIEMFVARASQEMAAAMTWSEPDAIVFTGGIGEHDDRTRAQIVERLHSSGRDDLPVLVVEAREDIVMADAADGLLLAPGSA